MRSCILCALKLNTSDGDYKKIGGFIMNDKEKQLYNAMKNIYHEAKDLGYIATRFMHMLGEKGPMHTACSLILKEGGTEGFFRLWELRRLDLSVEALVLNDDFKELFSDEERERCRERLTKYDYFIDK